MNFSRWGIFGILVFGLLGCASVGREGSTGGWTIRPGGVGPLQVGMTVVEAEKALGSNYQVVSPKARPVMIDEAAFAVRDRSGALVAEFTMEEAFNPLAAGNRIEEITVRSPLGATAEGVRPGMRVGTVAGIYGPATVSEEIEGSGGERLRFRKQPSFVRFLVSSPAGIYGEASAVQGERVTEVYRDDARVTGISVGR